MFKTRLLSGIVLIIIALATIICGGPVLLITLLCVSMIGMQELYKAVKMREDSFCSLEIVSYVGIILYYLGIWLLPAAYHLPILLCGLILILFVYVFSYPKYETKQIMAAFFGMVYAGVMMSFIYQTRVLEEGQWLVWLIFICSWGCDTCAYCVGVLFGKHKMAPVLSPKKSIEGAVGGVVGAALLGALYAWIIGHFASGFDTAPWMYAILCAAGALVSMVGDLAASAIKRQENIKDYGKLIPGHGGILDRFDSVIFTAPIIYFLAIIIM